MSVRPFLRVPVGLATVSLLSVLALSSGFLVSQATVSAGRYVVLGFTAERSENPARSTAGNLLRGAGPTDPSRHITRSAECKSTKAQVSQLW